MEPETRAYIVRWDIEVDATSPEAAAEIARDIQQDEYNIATMYWVQEVEYPQSRWSSVDLTPKERA